MFPHFIPLSPVPVLIALITSKSAGDSLAPKPIPSITISDDRT